MKNFFLDTLMGALLLGVFVLLFGAAVYGALEFMTTKELWPLAALAPLAVSVLWFVGRVVRG